MELYFILLVLGMCLACGGMLLYFLKRDYEYRHTVEVKGKVVSCEEKPIVMQAEDGEVQEGTNILTYFTYDIEGTPYTTARFTKDKYVEGETISLKCNPENMKDVVEAKVEGKDPKNIYSVMMLSGFLLMVAGLLLNYI